MMKKGVNMTGNKDIKQPDITKTFPCNCPCPWRFTKTVSNNYSLTLSRASNTSDRELRAGDFQESIYNAKNTIICNKTTDSKYLKPQQSSNAGSLRGENGLFLTQPWVFFKSFLHRNGIQYCFF